MKRVLKEYKLNFQVKGPVFIGNGNEIKKKEYLFLTPDTVGIIDINRFYSMLRKRHLENQFEKFMLGSEKTNLRNWMFQNKISLKEAEKCMKYTIQVGDGIRKTARSMQVMEYIKDPYGKPYVPGSSVKGMLRTVLLCSDIRKYPEKYMTDQREIIRELEKSRGRNRKILTNQIKCVENRRYHLLNRKEDKKNAVNDVMAGFIVSDSEPLNTDQLILCQKIERHPDGKEKPLNLMRECLAPGTTFRNTLTIDTSICPWDASEIKEAIERHNEIYYDEFVSHFKDMDRPFSDSVYLGGGCGFQSKTMVASMFPGRQGVRTTKEIFDKIGVPEKHHSKDMGYGVSPHIYKCTYYKGQTLPMGVCRMDII